MSKEVDLDFTNLPEFWIVSDIQNETEFVTDYVANGSFASLAENVKYNHQPDYAVLIRLTDFNNGFVGDFVYVDENAYNFLNKSKLYGGEIIISNVGAYSGTTFLAPNLNRPMTLGPNSIMMNFKNGNGFYYYWFRSPIGKFLLDGIISGSAQPKFNKTTFRKLKIPVPPLPEQKAIAFVLSSLDDKIDLLHRQNKTLEAMAETLFRQWFVEEAENNWGEEKLESIISVKGGTTPSTKEPDFWNGSIYWTTPRDLSSHDSVFLFDTERKITDKGLAQIGSGLLPIGTVLLSSRAPIGYLAITNIPVAINQGYIAIICDKVVSNLFIYLWCKANLDEIKNSGNGSVFQEISKSTFKAMAISLPPKKLLLEFDTKIFPIFNKIKINQSQIRTLETLRDTLLPKLMSGEVRVAV